MAFKEFETEEEYNKALEDVRTTERAKFSGYASPADIGAYEERIKALTEKQAQLQQENDGYRLSALKAKIARSAGIPPDLAERLNGSTEEELKTDAESLRRFATPLAPLKSTEKPPESGYDAELKKFTNALLGKA